MANRNRPPRPKSESRAVTPEEALGQILSGRPEFDIRSTEGGIRAFREGIIRAQAASPRSSDAEDLPGEIAGSGNGAKRPPNKRPPNRTSLDRIPGRRPMKEYPLSKPELWTLGGIQLGSAVSFSLAGTCFGLWSSTKQQLAFAQGAKPQIAGYWQGVGDMAFYGMIGLAIIGAALFLLSGFNVLKIIWTTEHRK